MRSPSTRALVRLLLLAAACLSSCGAEDREGPSPVGETGAAGDEEYYARALRSAEQAPEIVRNELLRKCDRWRHLDRPCDDERVRRELLDCWAKKGEKILHWTEARRMGPRASYQRTLLEVDVCMEMRRWRRHGVGPPL
jgi:hypothetical protein